MNCLGVLMASCVIAAAAILHAVKLRRRINELKRVP